MDTQKPSRALRTAILLGVVLTIATLFFLRVVIQPQNETMQRLTLVAIETQVRETATIEATLTALYSP